MFKPILASLSLAAAATLFPCNANAFLWGLFGHKDRDQWRSMDPAQQDIMAKQLYEEAQSYAENDHFKKARKTYSKVWINFPSSKYAPEALFEMGQLSMREHKWKYALRSYNNLIKSYPENENFDEMVSDLFTIGEAYETGQDIHYFWVIPYRDRTKAIQAYESLASVAPYNDLSAVSLLRVAMLHREMHELLAAVSSVDRVINDYPNSMEAPDATMLMARYIGGQVAGPAYDQAATHEAMDYYRDFTTLYPTNPAVEYCETQIDACKEQYAESKALMGEFFYKYRDDYDSAAVFFNDAITIAPDSKCAETCKQYLDKIAKIKERYPDSDWPRRNEWQYLVFWRKWDPMKGFVPKKDAAGVDAAAEQAKREEAAAEAQSRSPASDSGSAE